MLIARHPQIVSLANVGAELERVIALNLRPVVDELDLLFVLDQRAIASVDAESVSELEQIVAVVVDEARRHASGKGFVQVQPRDSRVAGGRCIQAIRHNVNLVTEKAKPEIRQKIG